MDTNRANYNDQVKILSSLNYVGFKVNKTKTRTAFVLTNISDEILNIDKVEFLNMGGLPYEQEYMRNELISYENVNSLEPGEKLILTKFNSMEFSTSQIIVKLSCKKGNITFKDSLL